MRCFLAFDLPESVQQDLQAICRRLPASADVRWVRAGQFHVTAKFLGDIDGAVADRLRDQVRGLAFPAIRVQLHGLARFPPHGAPRVLWAGLAGDTAAMSAVAAELDRSATQLGVPPEPRPFVPHVTIGRVRSPRASRQLLQELERLGETVAGEPFVVPALTLYRSELHGTGPAYTILAQASAARSG